MTSPIQVAKEESAASSQAPASPGASSPRKRSRWSISLGGVLIFAAGMMVGFAPMRAWLYFRDEPFMVQTDLMLFEIDADRRDDFHKMLNAAQSDPEAKPVDLKPILSKCGKVTVLSEPTIMHLVGQTGEFRSGGERLLPAADGSGDSPRFFGISASLTPKLRPSGKMEFVYRIEDASIVHDDAGAPAQLDEREIESSAILEFGEWHAIDMNKPTAANVRNERVRILALRPYWMMRHR